jgi:hypothetical protein
LGRLAEATLPSTSVDQSPSRLEQHREKNWGIAKSGLAGDRGTARLSLQFLGRIGARGSHGSDEGEGLTVSSYLRDTARSHRKRDDRECGG